MEYRHFVSLCFIGLVLGQTLALPQPVQYSVDQYQQIKDERKFAEKPNAMKKVGFNEDLDDVSTNQIQV